MASFVLHDTQQRPAADRILFQSGQPAVNFAQGSLVPLQGQKVFVIAVPFVWLFHPKPPRPGSGGLTVRSPQKSAGTASEPPQEKAFTPASENPKNPSSRYCVFCSKIHPRVFPIHPKVFFMA